MKKFIILAIVFVIIWSLFFYLSDKRLDEQIREDDIKIEKFMNKPITINKDKPKIII